MPVDASKSIVQEGSSSYPTIEQGLYDVLVVDVLYKEGVETKWGIKNKYQFILGILNKGAFRGRRIIHFTTDAFTSGYSGGQASALYTLACTILGTKLDPKIKFDVNSLIGKRVQVLVKPNERGYVDVKEILTSKSTDTLTDKEIEDLMPKKEVKSDIVEKHEELELDLDSLLERYS